uniref:Uncharacterized protein n=1 Tax=Glossina palpalis gambiensis TaxID=67801 RepID=A0A1B0BQ16_9MUSC
MLACIGPDKFSSLLLRYGCNVVLNCGLVFAQRLLYTHHHHHHHHHHYHHHHHHHHDHHDHDHQQ